MATELSDSELNRLSKHLSRWLQSKYRVERTPDEIADTLLIEAGGTTHGAILMGESYLRGEANAKYLINHTCALLAIQSQKKRQKDGAK